MRNARLIAAALSILVPALAAALEVRGGYYWLGGGEGGYVFAELEESVPGLVTVDMSYPNAEHNVKALRAVPFGTGWSELALSLYDGDQNDPQQGTIRWGDLRPYPVLGTHELSRTGCAGSCRVTMPSLAWDEAFVLAGFSFVYHDYPFSGDARVEQIMVRPRPYSGFVDVAFDDGNDRRFDVRLAYVRIPIEAVAGFDAMTSAVPVRGIVTSTRTPGPAVLQGFSLSFTNGGHPLHRFTVDLRNNNLMTLRWRDLNGDDLFDWSASWVRLVE